MAKLSYGARKKMPKSEFALPSQKEGGKGGYPIPDKSHARNALARVAQHGTAAEKATVRRKVHAKFPTIGSMATGGTIPATGAYLMHAGEQVIPNPNGGASGPMTRDAYGNNCNVGSCTDHSHVSRVTPLDTKKKEMQMANALAEPDQRKLEHNTTAARAKGNAKPLDGIK